jgi:hypothetical protein
MNHPSDLLEEMVALRTARAQRVAKLLGDAQRLRA